MGAPEHLISEHQVFDLRFYPGNFYPTGIPGGLFSTDTPPRFFKRRKKAETSELPPHVAAPQRAHRGWGRFSTAGLDGQPQQAAAAGRPVRIGAVWSLAALHRRATARGFGARSSPRRGCRQPPAGRSGRLGARKARRSHTPCDRRRSSELLTVQLLNIMPIVSALSRKILLLQSVTGNALRYRLQ